MKILKSTLTFLLGFVVSTNALADYWDQLTGLDKHQSEMTYVLVGDHYRFTITSAMDLACYVYMTNHNKNNSVEFPKYNEAELVFTADIDLAGHTWRAINEENTDWKGSIDGQGHCIKNMTVGGSGSTNSGLIDTMNGDVEIKNLTFENCVNECNHENTGLIVGYVVGKLTVENVTFKNCKMKGGLSSGAVTGCMKSKSEVTLNGIKLENCTLNGGDQLGGLIGLNESANLTVSDVTVDQCTIHGDEYVGGVLGWSHSNAHSELDAIHVIHTTVYGNEFTGGIVGEWQGTGTLKNSQWRWGKFQSGKYDELGGLVGKFYGSFTSVQIENCTADAGINNDGVPDHAGNIGVIAGYASDNAAVTMTNVAAIGNISAVQVPANQRGYIMGSAESNCHITVENGYVDDYCFKSKKLTPDSAAFGRNMRKSTNLVRKNINNWTTTVTKYKTNFYIAQINEKGGCMGELFRPLTTTDGMRIYYNVPDGLTNKVQVSVKDIQPDMLNPDKDSDQHYRIGVVGEELCYTFTPASGQWIVKDLSEGFVNGTQKRQGATQFSGMPTDNRQARRILSFETAPIPEVAIRTAKFDVDRQMVALKWYINNSSKIGSFWQNGHWQILRNGKVIAENIGYETTEFVDDTCPLGQKNTYTVNLMCEDLSFKGNQTGNFTTEVDCTAHFELHSTLLCESGKNTVSANLPNSKHFDGCSVSLYRFTGDELPDPTNEKMVGDLIAAGTSLATTTYHYQPTSEDRTLTVSLKDTTNENPCTMFHYYLVCSNFVDGSFYKGQTFRSQDTPIKPNQKIELTAFTASKGESPEKVKIEWSTRFLESTTSTRYTLWRKNYFEKGSDWQKIYEVNNSYTTNTYSDETLPGYVYEYLLRASVGCENVFADEIYDDERTDIGYTASRGTIMGSVSYATGNTSVQGVDVRLAADSLSMNNKGTLSWTRYFTGEDDRLPLAPRMGRDFWNGDWTLQFLLRPFKENEEKNLLSICGMKDITLKNGDLCIGDKSMSLTSDDFTPVIIRRDSVGLKIGYAATPDRAGIPYTNWSITLGNEEVSAVGINQPDSICFGASPSKASFAGLIDEVRLWSIALDDSQVKSTFDRYLTGNETGLAAYYTFDSGVEEYAFDESHPGGIWNNRHTTLPLNDENKILPSLRSDMCPSQDILCYRGVTDANGEYQIAGIPFSGEGTNYMVVPIYGTHEFQPASTRRYVSGQSLVHDGVKFSDVSSFSIDIQACYALGNYPAEGLSVLVDGAMATDSNGQSITTDANGQCTVSVPVGMHRLSLYDPKHTMVNNGYPCSIDSISADGIVSFTPLQGANDYIDFQASTVAPLTFFDNTYARVAGRVVGGTVESSKPLGGRLSHANLGQVEITLEPSMRSGYNINNTTSDIRLSGNTVIGEEYDDIIQSTTTYRNSSSDIVIRTDTLSGEFLALIPPVSMRIKDIHTTGGKGSLIWDDFKAGNQTDLITIDMENTSSDTITVDAQGNELATPRIFNYHAKKNFTYFVDPEISVVNALNRDGAFPQMLGDSVWVNRYEEIDASGNKQVVEDIVNLWNPDLRDGSPASYLLNGVPVFTQSNEYGLDISLFERYHNCDTGLDSLYYIPNVEIEIHNALATQNASAVVTNGVMEYTLDTENQQEILEGSPDGTTRYTFKAGFPNPQDPYTLDLSMSYATNGKVYTYPEEGSIQGIVLGCVNVPGSDFVTAGPDVVSFVLRDPPGGSSYSWIEQGTTVSSAVSFDNLGVGSDEVTTTTFTKTETQSYTAMGTVAPGTLECIVYMVGGSKQAAMFTGGVSTTWKAGSNDSHKLTYTLTDRLQTNNGAAYIGSQADIYVGSTTNFIFSKSRVLGLRKSPGGGMQGSINKYALEQYDGISQSVGFPTAFKYTQRHILQELIPGWRDIRRTCVDEVVADFNGLPERVTGDKPRYYVTPQTSDKKDIWEWGVDYMCVYPEGENIYVRDTINVINNHIQSWQNAIEENERIKVKTMRDMSRHTYTQKPDDSGSGVVQPESITMEYGYMGNDSFDAGATITKTMSREESGTEGTVDEGSSQAVLDGTKDFEIKLGSFADGIRVMTKNKAGYFHKGSSSKTETSKQTFGYTLSDSKSGCYYSVDAWLPGMMDGDGKLLDVEKGGKPRFDEFYVFRLAGGQSKCPYEPEEYTLFYKEGGKPVKIGEGTIAIEDPRVNCSQKVFTDIPNGQPMTFPVTLSNTSTANVKVSPAFTLNVDGSTNPDGLQFTIDGVPLSPTGGFEVLLLPGQSIQKMVTVKQSRTDVTHYEKVALRFASSGEPARAYSDTISFHYKPASSPVTLTLGNNVVNSQTANKAVSLTVTDYQPDFEKFAGIRIQYKTPTEMDWHTATVLVNDSTLLADTFGKENFPDVWEYLDRKADNTRFSVPLDRVADGEYLFRAQSFSPNGMTDEVTTESETLSVIKDTSAPALLTNPTPTSGYYTGTEEISIEMNESIDMALLTENNFSVSGALNDAEVSHMTGIHFDGNTPARTQSRVDVFGNSSAIAFWYKPQVGKNSCLISQNVAMFGDSTARVALHYNADATLSLWIGDEEHRSTRSAVDENGVAIEDWMYATIIIDREKSEMNVFNLFGTSTQAESHFLDIVNANVAADCNVPLYVGGSAAGDECHADIEELVLYDGAQEFATVAANKSNRHYDNLGDLLGYWPMDEGYGMTAADKVRNRNLTLQGTDNWYMPITNYALNLNGNSQYIQINTSQCAISSNQNYSLELLFRTSNAEPIAEGAAIQTLFSNGWGGADSPEPSLSERLSLSLTPQGQILFEAAGKSYTFGSSNYADRNWHHLVLDVDRRGYAHIYVDSEDICGTTNIAGSDLGGFANARMAVGAQVYNDGVNARPIVRNYFAGAIDEVRLWNAHRSKDVISSMANYRLMGNEVGLVAYYPFEKSSIVSNQVVTRAWGEDCVQDDVQSKIVNASSAQFVGSPDLLQNGPHIKAASMQQPIAVDFTHNGDNRIVLHFPDNLDKKRIEGCTLIFSVRNLQDLAGNRMLQPIVWNVFVEQKSLQPWLDDTELKQEIGQNTETDMWIYNNSPTSQHWTLRGLPNWLTAESTSGTLEPFGLGSVTLKTSDATSVGNYAATLLLEGEDGLTSSLGITLNVTSVRPDWKVEETDGSVWMSILGRLKVGNAWSTDENDMVGAFTSDGRCLGLASPEYNEDMSTYFLHMNIKGSSTDAGKGLYFAVWDASTSIIYIDNELRYIISGEEKVCDSLSLNSTTVLGNFTNPCCISTRDIIRQNFALHQGWNWISLWVNPKAGTKASDVFAPVAGNIVEVKNRKKGFTASQLEKLNVSLAEAYMVYVDKPVSFRVEGTSVNPADIKISFLHPTTTTTRWQWLGYPLYATQTLAAAFADFKPTANDVVKSENAYAMYNGHSWVGNLKYLSPGQGYMYGYHSTDSRDITWTYPSKVRSAAKERTLDIDPYDYENYTFVKVQIDGLALTDGRYQLSAATADGRCHGVADSEEGAFYLNIYGNDGETYTFSLYDRQTGEELAVGDPYPFDAVTPAQKVVITLTPEGLQNLMRTDESGNWYNASGIYVGKKPQGSTGVYISNGKKQLHK